MAVLVLCWGLAGSCVIYAKSHVYRLITLVIVTQLRLFSVQQEWLLLPK